VAGTTAATSNRTLLRRGVVTRANMRGGMTWDLSAGTTVLDSEWVVLPQGTFIYLGTHPNEVCDNGWDVDDDGLIDCFDPNCLSTYPLRGQPCDSGPLQSDQILSDRVQHCLIA
jgi:hypothetical protein